MLNYSVAELRVNESIMQVYGKNIYESLYSIDAKHHADGRM